jgi:ribonucleoside-diphosphate reductase alpha chain
VRSEILSLLKARYFLNGENSWEDLVNRVAPIYPSLKQDLLNFNFIFSSPTLMNYNTQGKRLGTLSSCFPMGIEDSISGIFQAVAECAEVTKCGGGVGYKFSKLRGNKEAVKRLDNKYSSGPIYFMNVYNYALEAVKQTAARRGAGMALFEINHPNILDFITAKQKEKDFEYFNFSVMIPNSFYKQLEDNPNSPHIVQNVATQEKFELKDKEGKIVSVKQLWDLIVELSWKHAEPGIFNSDIAYDQCTVINVSKEVICNPCAEFTGIPYQSCNLGSINLANLVENKVFNWKKFSILIKKAVEALNNVIDENYFPLEKIKEVTLKTRPIGLGYMGLGTALYKMEIPYNSKEALDFVQEMNYYLTIKAMQESIELAKEYSCHNPHDMSNRPQRLIGSYLAFDYDLFIKANRRFFNIQQCREINVETLLDDLKNWGIRNSSLTSIAPTGTISTIAGVSSGIEPIFGLVYIRKISNDAKDTIYNIDPIFEEYLNKNFDKEKKKKILKEVSDNKGSCQKCSDIPKNIRKIFVVAGDLTAKEHLDILEVAAKNTSLSISKTINLPENTSKEELSKVFLEAHKRGIIGVTVYREGSKEGVLVHSLEENKKLDLDINLNVPKRSFKLPCEVHKVTVKGEKWIAFVGFNNGKPWEVFAGRIENVNLPKDIEKGFIVKEKSKVYSFEYEGEYLIRDISKVFNNNEYDDFARMVSFGLRHSGASPYLVETINKSKGDLTKFSKAIARTLKKYIKDGTDTGIICPACQNKVIYNDGCQTCVSCGWSKCG